MLFKKKRITVNLSLVFIITIMLLTLLSSCFNNDFDSDNILNSDDNCAFTSNSEQGDADEDGVGDACDSTSLIYMSERDGNPEIYMLNLIDMNRTQLTQDNSISNFAPTWSPDGRLIAYHSKSSAREYFDILVMERSGKNIRNLTESLSVAGDSYRPTWSPDGAQIAFQFDSELASNKLWILNINNPQNAANLISSSKQRHEHDPCWSPTGESIVFTTETLDTNNRIYSLILVDVLDKTEVKILTDSLRIWNAVFSADGQEVFFAKIVQQYFEIFSINLDGTNLRSIYKLEEGNVNEPSLSPRGDVMAFQFQADSDGESRDIAVLDLKSNVITRITTNGFVDGTPDLF
ncbi:MAG: TolB family protein [Calditrichia bacterium]